ncbi:MAG TPA: helix-turn-helix transcriptional regulator [Propionibacteriaceae bacterium]|nr:helix-turn-helix transcriptional regulator [Propionibacteriaceae bacterium]
MKSPVQRYCVCGTRLARDNPGDRCASCISIMPTTFPSAPKVSRDFWESPEMRAALASRHMGKVIREFRHHPEHGRRPLPQEQIASCFGLTQAQLSRIETGSPIVHLDRLIQWARTLAIPEERLWFALPQDDRLHEPSSGSHTGSFIGPTVPFRSSWTETFNQAVEDWKSDVQRRDFLRGTAYLATATITPALQWLLGNPESAVKESGTFLVGSPHIASVRQMTRTFRDLDNRFGGGHAREYLVRFLADEVAPLIRNGRYDSATGAALLSAVSESMLLAGWMSYDAGFNGVAQRYMTHALRLALAANDRLIGAETLAALSHQATYLRDTGGGIDLARAAGKTAKEEGHGALLAESFVMEAHAHARAGDEGSCAKALSSAETTLATADRTADPQWIGYFDDAYVSAKFGHCFKELRQSNTAETFARRSLDMDNSYVRGRAFNLALLATAHAQAGEVEEACTVGTQALDLTQSIRSARAVSYLRDLLDELEPFATSPAVGTFKAAAAPVLG